MPLITDWLMLGITAIYVIATIFICRANIKAANATRDQIAESQRQFNENRRLDVMPYLQFESTNQPGVDYMLMKSLSENDCTGGEYSLRLRVKNIGRGTAKDIEHIWTSFTNTYSQQQFVIKALQNGDARFLQISFVLPKVLKENSVAILELHFKDLLENEYIQRIEFEFEMKNTSVSLKSHKTYPIQPAVQNTIEKEA